MTFIQQGAVFVKAGPQIQQKPYVDSSRFMLLLDLDARGSIRAVLRGNFGEIIETANLDSLFEIG